MPTVGLFIPCYVDQLYPGVGLARLRVWSGRSFRWSIPRRRTAAASRSPTPAWAGTPRPSPKNSCASSAPSGSSGGGNVAARDEDLLAALRRAAPAKEPPLPDLSRLGVVFDDPAAELARSIEAVGGLCLRVPNRAAAG